MPFSANSQKNLGAVYGFVVLHYRNVEDTIACINSILDIEYSPGFHIVLVDNASPDNSLEVLRQTFKGNVKISIIESSENGGYSRGNNIGIRTLLSMGIDQIIIATNDTEVISKNILYEFNRINSHHVGAIGPTIVTREGVFQNPPYVVPTCLYMLNLYFHRLMLLIRGFIYDLSPKFKSNRDIASSNERAELLNLTNQLVSPKVYMLHGAFIYLTRQYIQKIGVLDEGLFMYGEEDLISWYCEEHKLDRIFLPDIKVLHKDALSTKLSHQDQKSFFVSNQARLSNQYLRRQIKLWPLLKIWISWKFNINR